MLARRSKVTTLIVIALLVSACSGSRTLDLVRGINDVSITAINANALPPPNNLSDARTAQILIINKQLLDIIQANPTGLKAQLVVVITNARQALPKPIDTKVEGYLTILENLIKELR